MTAQITVPTLPIVIGTAMVDSVNPCAIGVLVLLIVTLLELSNDKKQMLTAGLIYVAAVFATYLVAGFGLLYFIQRARIGEELTWIVGGLVILLGLIELKDFFWYGKGISLRIPKKRAKQIRKYMHEISIGGAIFLGAFVAAVELPCTGGPYLAITTILAQLGFNWTVFWLLALYNLIFVLPLLIILFLIYFGIRTDKVKEWKDTKKKWMRLFMGLGMIILGILMILWRQGFFDFIYY